jgi:hypothetical protein
MKQLIVKDILGQFFPQLTEDERLYGRFQQDPATPHTARISRQALSDIFEDTINSSGIWPALPDLNSCDFSLLGLFEGQSLQQ